MKEPQEPCLGSGASQGLEHPRGPEEMAEGAPGRTDTATHLLFLEACEIPAVVESHLLPFPVFHEGGSCRMLGSNQGQWAPWMMQNLFSMPLAERRPGPHK